MNNEAGKHFDTGKSRVDLIPADVLISIGDVFEYGSHKYGETNWVGGIRYTKLLGSAIRHIFKFKAGEDIDYESNLSHLDHAIVNLIMLKYMVNNRKDLDDRWECGKTKGAIGVGVFTSREPSTQSTITSSTQGLTTDEQIASTVSGIIGQSNGGSIDPEFYSNKISG